MSNSQTFGAGPLAVRVLPRTGGCEVRFGYQMLRGNEDLQHLLAYLHQDPDGVGMKEFASGFGLPEDSMGSQIRATLRSLAEAGIPLETWGEHWCSVAQDEGTADR